MPLFIFPSIILPPINIANLPFTQSDSHWDVKHNQSARGFTTTNGGTGAGAKVSSYNNPSGLYSEENLKQALNNQTETLAQGVKG